MEEKLLVFIVFGSALLFGTLVIFLIPRRFANNQNNTSIQQPAPLPSHPSVHEIKCLISPALC